MLTVFLMITRIPSDYKPHALTKSKMDAISHQNDLLIADFYNQKEKRLPFSVSYKESTLNELLTLLQTSDYLGKSFKLNRFQKIQLCFKNNLIYIRGLTHYQGRTVVVSLRLLPEITPDQQLKISIKSPHIGLLSIKKDVIFTTITQHLKSYIDRKAHENPDNDKNQSKSNNILKTFSNEIGPLLLHLIENGSIVIQNSADYDNETITLTNITITDGVIALQLNPTSRQPL
jgi:hypothetical protein